jgi:dGTPase
LPRGQIHRFDRRNRDGRARDERNAAERDRDRVLYSAAFRRLAGVTQVFHSGEGAVYHNRLTHSLKVAQIARRTTQYLLGSTPREIVVAAGGMDADIAETAALCHDLGHPPFGHAAEEELNRVAVEGGCRNGFEGNAQSFRIITKLSIRSGDHQGLNLTRASLAAILKYPWLKGGNGKKSQTKWGAYASEIEDFEFARATYAKTDKRKSLEAEIMDWADDVTYAVHDLDDCFRSGLIPLDRLIGGTDELSLFLEYVYKGGAGTTLARSDAEYFFATFLRFFLQDYELLRPFSGTRRQRAGLDYLSSMLIRRYVFGPPQPLAVVDDLTEPRLQISTDVLGEVQLLKALMKFYVYNSPALVGQQIGQQELVSRLFHIFLEAANTGSGKSGIIPHPFRESIRSRMSAPERARFACDIVASMTEQQALLMHKRLTGIEPGSVLDSILR